MSERWLPVVGHEELYEVSDRGRLRSLPRLVTKSNGRTQRREARPKKGTPTADGYVSTWMRPPGGRKHSRLVHHLVLEAFVGPRPPGMECRHMNGRRDDNRVENLRWGTKQENQADRLRHGTDQCGQRNYKAKLTWRRVREIRRRHSEGETAAALAAAFSVHVMTVKAVVRGRTWKEQPTTTQEQP